jgi:hypothetical protein
MSLYDVAKAIEASRMGTAMRESMYWFAALNLVHLLGLLIAAGTVVFWDLRLLGIGLRRTPVSEVGKSLLPWTWGGFTAMFLSGSLLVIIEAGRLYSSVFFRIKVAALLLAGLNVLLFHLTIYRKVDQWDRAPTTPLQARIAGALSILLWFCILAAGRAIGYTLDYSV